MTLFDALVIVLAFGDDPDLSDETQELVFEARQMILQWGCALRKIRRNAIIDDA